ncbi:replication initiation protein [Frankia sp. CNm7]|uniref:Replication initiation protein n=2 Tax=Frankia nepalensis TaxID=1836974 RepID=A0A937RFK8_9ACTN|nr:replication initiator [Frankia nepalensis]MBL7498160.1 replication initiation protein [Frankia nepalensis]MBL7509322.1 replication initiation protein [Frankia nepalensis]MBL7516890.1 replication initiation protein [Frankia nepalensis]MBL7627949.1 replication initiation protein [Frankia nepalensis]
MDQGQGGADLGPVEPVAGEQELRPGSRLDRMRMPLARQVVEAVAVEEGVCVRPVALRRVDLATGETTIVPAPCGATLASKCPPCAERARRLRMAQCKAGWHLDDEPLPEPDPPSDEAKELGRLRADLEQARTESEQAGDADGVAEADGLIGQVDEALAELGVRGKAAPDNRERPRRTRSTRRRQDAPDLPRLPVDKRTVGRTYVAADGTAWRPSMFLTLTCDSYGRVLTDGTPVDPDAYDYRRAARDAIHFPKLIDRFWQNLRRAVGWEVQYFAALEPQRRLAPHLHAAFRGTVPRIVLRQVAAATYHQVWWPATDQPVYPSDGPGLPGWDEQAGGYVDPTTGAELVSWDEALDAIGPDDEPAHVVRFGPQIRADGVTANNATVGKLIGYLTKYLTKSLDGCHGVETDRQRAHVDRLAAALRYEPCSPTCANWLLHGITPKNPRPGLVPGRCKGKAHRRETLGFGGRRVLVSRKWSGKTLGDHKADRVDFVRAQLEALGQRPDSNSPAAQASGADPDSAGAARVAWELVRPGDPDAPRREYLILHAIANRQRWRAQLAAPTAVGPPSGDLPSVA